MRILGLDWGTARVGAAMSDEGQTMAFPLQNTLDTKSAVKEIQNLVKEYEIQKIIMGWPLSLNGSENASTQKTKKFQENLSKAVSIPVELVDERFSTLASTKVLQAQKIKEKDQRHIKDNIAASLMLQQYLDSNKK